MTPGVTMVRKSGVAHRVLEYEHDPNAAAYGEEAATALGLEPETVFKTLVAEVAGRKLVVAIVPVTAQLDLKALAGALGEKKAAMADPAEAERATGYVVGGISPFGQKRRLPTVLDRSATTHAEIYVSGGKRGLEIALAPDDLVALLDAKIAVVARRRGNRP